MPKTQVSYPHRHSRWFLVPTTFVVGTSAKAYKENAAPALKHRLRIFSLKYYVFSKTTEVRYNTHHVSIKSVLSVFHEIPKIT